MSDHRSNPRTRREQEVYNRAMHVLARMRRTGESLTAAAHEEHIDPRTVRKFIGADLQEFREGRTAPTRADRRRRNMLIPTLRGMEPDTIRGSEEASRLGKYMSALGQYLKTGNTDALRKFEGQSISGHPLITDPTILDHLAESGSFQLDSIYALPESSS